MRPIKKILVVIAFLGIMIPLNAVSIDSSNTHREELKVVGPPEASHSSGNTVELLVFVDYQFIQIHDNNTAEMFRYVSQVIHGVSEIYENEFGIGIVLVNMIFFSEGDPYPLNLTVLEGGEISVDDYLYYFHQYRSYGGLPHHDYAVLLSGYDFESSVKYYAGIGVMGYTSDAGMIAETQNSVEMDTVILARGIGNACGMQTDSRGNACPDRGYIMSPYFLDSPLPSHFSDCSHAYLDAYDANPGLACLKDVPTSSYSFDAPENCSINTLGSGNSLTWNVTDIILADVHLNGELFNSTLLGSLVDIGGPEAKNENIIQVEQNNLTLNVDRMQLVAGNNTISAWFYVFNANGSMVPVKSTVSVALNASLAPEFVYPLGGESLKDVVTVSWEGGASPASGITYDLYFRRSNEAWILIEDGIAGTSYSWDTTNLAKGDGYTLKLVARPNDGGTWVSTRSGPFGLVADDSNLIIILCIVLGVGGIVAITAVSLVLKKRKQSRAGKSPV